MMNTDLDFTNLKVPMRIYFLGLLFTFLLIGCSNEEAESLPERIHAKVIRVIDGDTIEVLFNGKPLKIRFAHVDCPEFRKKQPFGSTAKKFISDMCFGRYVFVSHSNEFDRNERLIAEIINDEERNLNKELIRNGLAWHFKRYSKDSDYARIEDSARNEKVGLWIESNPVPPWEWRAVK